MASEQRVHGGESIAAVVKKAEPGARIVIEPGLYRENVRINLWQLDNNAVLGIDIRPGGDLSIREDCRIDQRA